MKYRKGERLIMPKGYGPPCPAASRFLLTVPFDMICEANGIEHRLTKPNHPWTNGQVERMNRTIKDATVDLPRDFSSTWD